MQVNLPSRQSDSESRQLSKHRGQADRLRVIRAGWPAIRHVGTAWHLAYGEEYSSAHGHRDVSSMIGNEHDCCKIDLASSLFEDRLTQKDSQCANEPCGADGWIQYTNGVHEQTTVPESHFIVVQGYAIAIRVSTQPRRTSGVGAPVDHTPRELHLFANTVCIPAALTAAAKGSRHFPPPGNRWSANRCFNDFARADHKFSIQLQIGSENAHS